MSPLAWAGLAVFVPALVCFGAYLGAPEPSERRRLWWRRLGATFTGGLIANAAIWATAILIYLI
jgi:hypothetical protein